VKRSSRSTRAPANLSETVHQRLNMYALAASAAGVEMLVLAHPAEAKIVYTPTHVVIGLHDSYKLDLNHDGIADFTILNTSTTTPARGFSDFQRRPLKGMLLKPASPTTPQPATLGLLALGSPGLSIWRREESELAARYNRAVPLKR
jgi:hypothetical protein